MSRAAVRRIEALADAMRAEPAAWTATHDVSERDLRAVLALAKRCALPSIVTKQQLKFAGDVLGRHAAEMHLAGARHAEHYALNQLAHWFWERAASRKPVKGRR